MKHPQYWIENVDAPPVIWRVNTDGKTDIGDDNTGWSESQMNIILFNVSDHVRRISKREAAPLFPVLFGLKEKV